MNISDKNLGYLTIMTIVGLLLWLTISMYLTSTATLNTLTLVFDDVGTLQPQDPVTRQGLTIGSVSSIHYENQSAVVVVSFDEPVLLRDSSRFINYNYSLMGERRIKIISSKKGDIIQPGSTIRGEFEPGISEAMHKMQFMINQLNLIRDFLLYLSQGSESEKPFHIKLFREIEKTEKIIETIDATISKYHPKLMTTINTMSDIADQGIKITETVDTAVGLLTEKSNDLIRKTSDLIKSVHSITHDLEQHTTTISSLSVLQNDSLFSSIQELVTLLNGTILALKNSGLEMKDKDGNKLGLFKLKNINIFGETGREKRARLTK